MNWWNKAVSRVAYAVPDRSDVRGSGAAKACSAILGGRHIHDALKLSHKMCFVAVPAHGSDFLPGKRGGGEKILGMLNAALDNILHYTGAENFLIQMLEVGFADGQTMRKTGYIPVKVGHVINTETKHGHFFIIGTDSFIRKGMEFFAQLHEEQLQVQTYGLFPIMVGRITFVGDIFNEQGKIIDIV